MLLAIKMVEFYLVLRYEYRELILLCSPSRTEKRSASDMSDVFGAPKPTAQNKRGDTVTHPQTLISSRCPTCLLNFLSMIID